MCATTITTKARNARNILFVAVVFSWIWIVNGVVAQAEIIDRVLAVVAGDAIMLSDVRAARVFALIDPDGAADPIRAVLTRLIDRALVLDEVERYAPPEPSATAVDEQLRRVQASFTSRESLAGALAEHGIDEAHLRAFLRDDLRIRAYLDQRFTETERQAQLVEEWVTTLRGRAAVVDLYGDAPPTGR